MKNFKERILNALFEEENSNKGVQQEMPRPVQSQATSESTTSNSNVEVNSSLLDTIEKKIQEADIPGPDYLELKSAAEEASLVSEEPDEGKRWKLAFRNMKIFFPKANITKSNILGAIDHYIGIVNKENEIGLQELEVIRNRDVVKELESVKILESEISDLERQIELKKKEMTDKNLKIQANRDKYDGQEKVFKKTIGYVLDTLTRDKEKINKYIND